MLDSVAAQHRNIWWILLSHRCQNFVYTDLTFPLDPCWRLGWKVKKPFEPPFCRRLKIFCVQIWLIMSRCATLPGGDSRWASPLLASSTYWESVAFGRRLDTNAAFLPNSLAWLIARRLNLKASNLESIVCHVCFEFHLKPFKLLEPSYATACAGVRLESGPLVLSVITWPKALKRPTLANTSTVAWVGSATTYNADTSMLLRADSAVAARCAIRFFAQRSMEIYMQHAAGRTQYFKHHSGKNVARPG